MGWDCQLGVCLRMNQTRGKGAVIVDCRMRKVKTHSEKIVRTSDRAGVFTYLIP